MKFVGVSCRYCNLDKQVLSNAILSNHFALFECLLSWVDILVSDNEEDITMRARLLLVSAIFCAGFFYSIDPAIAQYSSSGPQYHGTGITTNSDNQQVDRAGSPLYFGGPSTANAVFLGGTPIMRVRVGAAGYTPDERASAIQARLNLLLGEGPITPDEITTAQSGSDAVVLVKGQLLFTADTETARVNSTSTTDLASSWAERLRSVLPGLTEAK